jgi:uncharacterized protein (TIGR03437 family)
VDQNFMVTPGSQTITFAALSSQVVGSASFTVSATASSGLTVGFQSTTAPVCTVSGASVTLVSAGTCTIQATQSGNASYAAAPPVNQSFMVTAQSQTITFGTLPNQPLGTPPFKLSSASSSGLAVTLTSSTAPVCTASGSTITLLLVGTCTLQATQPGNAVYAAAPSISQSFMVTQGNQTIAFGPLSNQAFGAAPFAVRATASSGLPVTFASTALSVCRMSAANVTLLGTGACTIQASQPGNAQYAPAPMVSQTFTVGSPPTVGSILNAASYATIPVTADGYTVAFGSNFSATTAETPSVMLPSILAGATVTITDSNKLTLPATLYYVSPAQINFLVPEGLALGKATVTVTSSNGGMGSFATTVAHVSPALFTADSSGHGAPAALAFEYDAGGATQAPAFSCGGSPAVCTAAPIDLGPPSASVYLVLFGTGIRGRNSLSGVSVTVGGKSLEVDYAGAQGTFPGLDQINVLLDRSLIGQGQQTLQLTVDGVAANQVLVNIR